MEKGYLYHKLSTFMDAYSLKNDEEKTTFYEEFKSYVNDIELFSEIRSELHTLDDNITIELIDEDIHKIITENSHFLDEHFADYIDGLTKALNERDFYGVYPLYYMVKGEDTYFINHYFDMDGLLITSHIMIYKATGTICHNLDEVKDVFIASILKDPKYQIRNFSIKIKPKPLEDYQDFSNDEKYLEILTNALHGITKLPKWYMEETVGNDYKRLRLKMFIAIPLAIALAFINFFVIKGNFLISLASIIVAFIIADLISKIVYKEKEDKND